jgi:hypothetical protein
LGQLDFLKAYVARGIHDHPVRLDAVEGIFREPGGFLDTGAMGQLVMDDIDDDDAVTADFVQDGGFDFFIESHRQK